MEHHHHNPPPHEEAFRLTSLSSYSAISCHWQDGGGGDSATEGVSTTQQQHQQQRFQLQRPGSSSSVAPSPAAGRSRHGIPSFRSAHDERQPASAAEPYDPFRIESTVTHNEEYEQEPALHGRRLSSGQGFTRHAPLTVKVKAGDDEEEEKKANDSAVNSHEVRTGTGEDGADTLASPAAAQHSPPQRPLPPKRRGSRSSATTATAASHMALAGRDAAPLPDKAGVPLPSGELGRAQPLRLSSTLEPLHGDRSLPPPRPATASAAAAVVSPAENATATRPQSSLATVSEKLSAHLVAKQGSTSSSPEQMADDSPAADAFETTPLWGRRASHNTEARQDAVHAQPSPPPLEMGQAKAATAVLTREIASRLSISTSSSTSSPVDPDRHTANRYGMNGVVSTGEGSPLGLPPSNALCNSNTCTSSSVHSSTRYYPSSPVAQEPPGAVSGTATATSATTVAPPQSSTPSPLPAATPAGGGHGGAARAPSQHNRFATLWYAPPPPPPVSAAVNTNTNRRSPRHANSVSQRPGRRGSSRHDGGATASLVPQRHIHNSENDDYDKDEEGMGTAVPLRCVDGNEVAKEEGGAEALAHHRWRRSAHSRRVHRRAEMLRCVTLWYHVGLCLGCIPLLVCIHELMSISDDVLFSLNKDLEVFSIGTVAYVNVGLLLLIGIYYLLAFPLLLHMRLRWRRRQLRDAAQQPPPSSDRIVTILPVHVTEDDHSKDVRERGRHDEDGGGSGKRKRATAATARMKDQQQRTQQVGYSRTGQHSPAKRSSAVNDHAPRDRTSPPTAARTVGVRAEEAEEEMQEVSAPFTATARVGSGESHTPLFNAVPPLASFEATQYVAAEEEEEEKEGEDIRKTHRHRCCGCCGGCCSSSVRTLTRYHTLAFILRALYVLICLAAAVVSATLCLIIVMRVNMANAEEEQWSLLLTKAYGGYRADSETILNADGTVIESTSASVAATQLLCDRVQLHGRCSGYSAPCTTLYESVHAAYAAECPYCPPNVQKQINAVAGNQTCQARFRVIQILYHNVFFYSLIVGLALTVISLFLTALSHTFLTWKAKTWL